MKNDVKYNWVWLHFLIFPAIVVMLIWLPFGFQMTRLIEEWDVLGLFAKNGVFFWAGEGTPLAAHKLRPLTVLPHAIAYALDSNSFEFWHLLQMLSLVLKGLGASIIAWLLTKSRGWAMFLGALVILYPADTMQLAFRGIHINFSIAMVLCSTAAVLIGYDQSSKKLRNVLTIIGVILIGIAILMYEAAILLTPMPFLILMARYGIKQGWHVIVSRPIITYGWIFTVCMGIIHALIVLSGSAVYQSGIVRSEEGFYNNVPKLFSIGLFRSLIGGWFDASRMVLLEYQNFTYLLVSISVCGAAMYIASRGPHSVHSAANTVGEKRWQLPARIALAGLLLCVLGYLPYLSSNAHMLISQRTYLFATPGAALMLMSCVMLLSSRKKLAASVIGATLLSVGMGAQLYQFHHYIQISGKQKKLLRAIVENFDGNIGNKTVLIFDNTEQFNHTWMLNNLSYALSYIYGKSINSVEICLMPVGHWQRRDSLLRNGTCVEESDRWILKAANPVSGPGMALPLPTPDVVLQKDNVIVIAIKPDGSVYQEPTLDNYRAQLAHGKTNLDLRYQNILVDKSWVLNAKQFPPIAEQSSYRWDFGRWWSMEQPIQGYGWREAEWDVRYFFHRASAWKTLEHSSLLFQLKPDDRPYVIEGKFETIISEPIRESIAIRINGQDLMHRWMENGKFIAFIPQGILKYGKNRVEFNSATDANYYGLSARLDWYEVHSFREIGSPLPNNGI